MNIFFKKCYVNYVITLLILGLFIFTGCTLNKQELILATTTSVYDSGLLDYLLPQFEVQNNCKIKLLAVGSGEAMKMGKKGDADVLLVHSPKDEEAFMRDGHGIKRNVFMYNYYLVAGPKDDPAKIRNIKSLKEALRKLLAHSKFLSRGDDSGTHKKELKLWNEARVKPWREHYIESGQGMGETLKMADEVNAYTLTDVATYESMKRNISLEVFYNDGDELLNRYSVIVINYKKFKGINKEIAVKFYKWLISKQTKERIEKYKGGGLFFKY